MTHIWSAATATATPAAAARLACLVFCPAACSVTPPPSYAASTRLSLPESVDVHVQQNTNRSNWLPSFSSSSSSSAARDVFSLLSSFSLFFGFFWHEINLSLAHSHSRLNTNFGKGNGYGVEILVFPPLPPCCSI